MSISRNDPQQPKAWEPIVAAGSGFGGANLIAMPGYAVFLQVFNEGAVSLSVRLNRDTACTFTLASNTAQVFNFGDAIITSVDFANHISGGGSPCQVQVIAGVIQG